MRRDLLLGLLCMVLLLFISMYAKAQIMQGGLGSVYTGPFYQINTSLQKDLSSDKLLGSAFKGNLLVASYGAEGFSVWNSGLVLGGYINYSTSTARAGAGSVTQNTGSAFITVGYRVINKPRWLGFSYWGVGGFAANFKIANYGTQTFVISKDSIAGGQSGRYAAGGMAFDFGFALKYFISDYKLANEKNLKSMVGLNVGASFFPAFQKWHNVNTDTQLETFNTPFIMAFYARVTLGIGIFTNKN